jgi:hypothetical protein
MNRDQILDLDEVIRWLIPSKGDAIYEEADYIFTKYDSNRDWDLNEDEVRSAYLSLIHLLPQSVWTDSSLAKPGPASIEMDDSFADEAVVEKESTSQKYKFLPNASSTQNHVQQSCDRELPFAIPLLPVCDIPRVLTR